MALDSVGLFDALVSHAASLGFFDRVAGHEPKNAPGNGLTCAIYWMSISPARTSSSLSKTSGVVTFTARIFNNMFAEPADGIDPLVMSATDGLIAAYSGDFSLGGLIRNVDLLGQSGGQPLSARAGYLKIDQTDFRTSDITIPLIINDLWTQAP